METNLTKATVKVISKNLRTDYDIEISLTIENKNGLTLSDVSGLREDVINLIDEAEKDILK